MFRYIKNTCKHKHKSCEKKAKQSNKNSKIVKYEVSYHWLSDVCFL